MGGVNSSELRNILDTTLDTKLDAKLDNKLDNKLKSIHDKLDAQGATIKSLSSRSGDCGSCDISSITDTLNTINDKIDDQGTIDGKLNKIISGINGLNDNIVDSYYYITDQNSNIAYGLNLESQGGSGVKYYSVASGRAYSFSAGCDTTGQGGDPHGWCHGPKQLFGLCRDQTPFTRAGDNSVLGNYPIKSSDRTCHLQN